PGLFWPSIARGPSSSGIKLPPPDSACARALPFAKEAGSSVRSGITRGDLLFETCAPATGTASVVTAVPSVASSSAAVPIIANAKTDAAEAVAATSERVMIPPCLLADCPILESEFLQEVVESVKPRLRLIAGALYRFRQLWLPEHSLLVGLPWQGCDEPALNSAKDCKTPFEDTCATPMKHGVRGLRAGRHG